MHTVNVRIHENIVLLVLLFWISQPICWLSTLHYTRFECWFYTNWEPLHKSAQWFHLRRSGQATTMSTGPSLSARCRYLDLAISTLMRSLCISVQINQHHVYYSESALTGGFYYSVHHNASWFMIHPCVNFPSHHICATWDVSRCIIILWISSHAQSIRSMIGCTLTFPFSAWDSSHFQMHHAES